MPAVAALGSVTVSDVAPYANTAVPFWTDTAAVDADPEPRVPVGGISFASSVGPQVPSSLSPKVEG